MKRAYENCRVSNPLRVFHGTKDANVASISPVVSKSLPRNSSYVTGRMFDPAFTRPTRLLRLLSTLTGMLRVKVVVE
jgi:hypothetical protein